MGFLKCFSLCYVVILLHMKYFGAVAHEYKIEYNVASDNDGKIITALPSSAFFINVVNFPSDATSLVFGAHTQRHNVTLSYDETPELHNSVAGTDVGMTLMIDDTVSNYYIWLFSNNSANVSVFLKVVQYKSTDLVPGGCNMEFPVEIAPFLRLSDDQFTTRLEFQHANMGSPKHVDPPSCSSMIHRLTYDIFVYYLEEHNYSEEEYFKGIRLMSNITFLRSHADKVTAHMRHPDTRAFFLKYPKTGAIYNIVAKSTADEHFREGAYVPIATYGCKLISKDLGCGLPYTTATWPLLIILTLFGLFIALFGHKYFAVETFFFGFLLLFFPSFIIIAKYGMPWSAQSTLLFSLALGVLGGLLWMLLWVFLFRPVLSVVPVGLILGFLVMATVLYTPLGNYSIFTDDRTYWVFISGGTVIITTLFLIAPKALSIIGSSVVGAYASILSLDNYLGSSLLFIVVNVLKRALGNHSIFAAINDFPFQTNNIIICTLWVAVTLLSIGVQVFLNRKIYFPKPSCACRKIVYSVTTYPSNDPPQEPNQETPRQPLLSQNCQHQTYSAISDMRNV